MPDRRDPAHQPRPPDGRHRPSRFRYGWHDLRHSAVSRLIAEGADIAVVQAVAGHANASTTLDVYAHVNAKRLEDAALEFDPGLTLS